MPHAAAPIGGEVLHAGTAHAARANVPRDAAGPAQGVMFVLGVGVTMFGVFLLNSHEPHELEGNRPLNPRPSAVAAADTT